jgi:hypothetical protein
MKEPKVSSWWKRFDLVRVLGSMGLRTLGMKLFVGILALTSLAILMVCVVAYMSFSGAIQSGEQLQGLARAAAEASDLFLSENVKYARTVASDDTVVAAAQKAAREAEKVGIAAPVVSTDQINRRINTKIPAR